jgi:predicted nucleic acid-binding protein
VILVDSNVIIDVIEDDQQWRDWSVDQISGLATAQLLAIDEVVVAEVGGYFQNLEDFLSELDRLQIGLSSLDHEGAFFGGAAFAQYRKRRPEGSRKILADFLIGGHAMAAGAAILTRDPRFFRSYFPTVPLIAPEIYR